MKQLRYLPFLVLLLALQACGGKPFLTDSETLEARMQETIARVESGLIIAQRQIITETTAGVFTKTQLADANDKLNKAGLSLDEAHKLRRAKLFSDALNAAISSEALLSTVQSLLAERIKQQNQGRS